MMTAFRRSLVLLVAMAYLLAVAKGQFAVACTVVASRDGRDAGGAAEAQEKIPAVPGQTGSEQTGQEQKGQEAKADAGERPLPDIPALMHAVEANQKAAEAIEKNYMYRSVQTQQEGDTHGRVKKTETKEYEVFWVEGVPVHRLVSKNGKALSTEEQKKESEQIDKEAAKAQARRAKANEKGEETDPHGNEMVTVSRLLELGSFTNARRVQLNGRDTIAIDFAGDPKAKTRSRSEEVIRDLVGTAWVDEQDRMLVKAQGHFLNSFKIGGGLVANIQKGTSFSMEQRKVNNEVWLPAMVEGQGAARMLLFFSFNGQVRAVESDYRKFKATSTIMPGLKTVEPEAAPK
jgi:hypothetical protein